MERQFQERIRQKRDDEEEDLIKEEQKKIGAYDRLQVPDHSLGGYSHREHCRATDERYFEKNEEENFVSIVSGKRQIINSTFHSHRESRFKNSMILGIALVKSRLKKSKI
jgi:hypothetical protein